MNSGLGENFLGRRSGWGDSADGTIDRRALELVVSVVEDQAGDTDALARSSIRVVEGAARGVVQFDGIGSDDA